MTKMSAVEKGEPFALGFLKDKMKFTITDDWKMTPFVYFTASGGVFLVTFFAYWLFAKKLLVDRGIGGY